MTRALVFDYGAGNLHSLTRALAAIGVETEIETDARVCAQRDELLVLPGVGAFGLAAGRIAPGRDALAVQLRAGRPCLGICLGMQLLFDTSDEGAGAGLSLIQGRVTKLTTRRCPHIGWTRVGDTEFYFAHSYVCRPVDETLVRVWANHDGERVPAIVKAQSTIGVQFHPEKSSRRGLELLRSLVDEVTS